MGNKGIPEFVNREREIKELKGILSGRPNLVYFLYGPINSGKTALLTKVFEELSKEYQVFYVNFRWRDVQNIDDLMRVLFQVKKGVVSEETKEFVKVLLRAGSDVLKRLKGIPIPENIFDLLFREKDRVEDVFAFLEEYFEEIKKAGYQPVFVIDEMQTVKEVVNATGKSVISGLFNFFVGMTKERHLCHCLCATSDCLFIEDVYSNARLEGRAKYILVDDLQKDEAFKAYEEFGFEDKELIWEYIEGKFGDMTSLYEDMKRGYSEGEALEGMLKNEVGRLEWIRLKKLKNMKDGEDTWKFLKNFKEKEELTNVKIVENFDNLLFWIEENLLFYNPVEGTVRPQSRLIQRAIEALS